MERLLDVSELQPQEWPRRASCISSSVMYTLYNTTLGECQLYLVFVAACCLKSSPYCWMRRSTAHAT